MISILTIFRAGPGAVWGAQMDNANIEKFRKQTLAFRNESPWNDSLSQITDAIDPLARVVFEELARSKMSDLINDIEHVLEQCESPIEKVFISAIMAAAREAGYETFDLYETNHDIDSYAPGSSCELAIWPQFEVGKYRIDFRLVAKAYDARLNPPWSTRKIMVECDGHEFHERTKEQAKRDRAKDRHLQALGYKILRFTGSEIWADPYKCAKETFTFLNGKAGV